MKKEVEYINMFYFNSALFLVSVVTLYYARRGVMYSKEASMPDIRFYKNIEQGREIYRATANNPLRVARITSYGYKDFNGEKVYIKQEVNQNTTYTITDWGQKLQFELQPKNEDVCYFFVYDVVSEKEYKFYPNGKWKSILNYWRNLINKFAVLQL